MIFRHQKTWYVDKLSEAVHAGEDYRALSRLAYDVYSDPGIVLSKEERAALTTLVAMDEGPEFELSTSDILRCISILSRVDK
jgi:hypothetical protein